MKQTLILRDIGEERRAESQNDKGRMAEKQIPVGEKKLIQGKNGKETKANDNEYFKEGRTALKRTLMLSDIGEERHAELI